MPLGGNIAIRQQFASLYQSRLAYIDEILGAHLDVPTLSYPRVFNVRTSTRAYEETLEMTGLGTFTLKNEAETIDYDKILEAGSKRFTHLTYAKGVQISKEAADDDIDGAISDLMPQLGESARVSIETTIWNTINSGYAGSTVPVTTSDGVALYSASHVLRGGGTASNLMTGDLSIAQLETALNMFDTMVNERGLPVEMSAEMLVFGPAYRWLVHEILKSDLRSDTANNASNAFKEISLSPVQTKYLAGADDWYLFTNPSKHRVLVYWREQPVSDHTIDFDTGNLKTKMTYRLSTGAATWRGTVGSQG